MGKSDRNFSSIVYLNGPWRSVNQIWVFISVFEQMTCHYLTPCATFSLVLFTHFQNFFSFFHTGLPVCSDILDPSVPELQQKLWIQLLWLGLPQKQCLIPEYKCKKSICKAIPGSIWWKRNRKRKPANELWNAQAPPWTTIAQFHPPHLRLISAVAGEVLPSRGKATAVSLILDMIFLSNCLLAAFVCSHWSRLCQLWLEKPRLALAAATAETRNSLECRECWGGLNGNNTPAPINAYIWTLSL